MALFQRKQKDSVLPEVDQYYQAERRDRGALAWVLAFVSIAVVALVIVALFLGGRWIYRELTDDEPEVVTTGSNTADAPTFDGTPAQDGSQPPASGSTGQTPDTTPSPSPQSSQGGTPGSTNSPQNQGQGTVNAPAQTTTPAATPATGDASGNLPSTGPAGLVATFAGVTTLAGSLHYVVSRKRSNP